VLYKNCSHLTAFATKSKYPGTSLNIVRLKIFVKQPPAQYRTFRLSSQHALIKMASKKHNHRNAERTYLECVDRWRVQKNTSTFLHYLEQQDILLAV